MGHPARLFVRPLRCEKVMYIQYIWPFRASPIGQKSFAI
jgi:hypothetical protein